MAPKLNKDPEVIEHYLRSLEQPAKKLTAWELDFLESVRDQFNHGILPDEQRVGILERIYTEKTT